MILFQIFMALRTVYILSYIQHFLPVRQKLDWCRKNRAWLRLLESRDIDIWRWPGVSGRQSWTLQQHIHSQKPDCLILCQASPLLTSGFFPVFLIKFLFPASVGAACRFRPWIRTRGQFSTQVGHIVIIFFVEKKTKLVIVLSLFCHFVERLTDFIYEPQRNKSYSFKCISFKIKNIFLYANRVAYHLQWKKDIHILRETSSTKKGIDIY